jgi:hypothetical protein
VQGSQQARGRQASRRDLHRAWQQMGQPVSDRRRWRSCGRHRQACPLAAGSASPAARARRTSRQGSAVLLRAGGATAICCCGSPTRHGRTASRGGARPDDRRPHIAQSRAGKAAGRSSDRPPPRLQPLRGADSPGSPGSCHLFQALQSLSSQSSAPMRHGLHGNAQRLRDRRRRLSGVAHQRDARSNHLAVLGGASAGQ